MGQAGRPHILGIDDGPFEKGASREVVVVGVMLEGRDLVEGVAPASGGWACGRGACSCGALN